MSMENAGPRDDAAPKKISAGGVKKGRNVGLKVITANSLFEGTVIYFKEDGSWTDELAEASIVEGDDAIELLDRATADEKGAVGPYLMDVEREGKSPAPAGRAALRERIRDRGPTIHPHFGRQAAER